jgi:DNA-binding NtrC family response regulator
MLLDGMVGQSAAMQNVYKIIARVASTDTAVLIVGESGTGKELAARAIHRNSPRVDQPFQALNCALLNNVLLSSELFGHEKGAFIEAAATRKGRIELADGGTLFLDELSELPQTAQSELLRVLQDRRFHRLGGIREIEVNVRIIAASNTDLTNAVRNNSFRADLLEQLRGVTLRIPPLRNRRDDIPALVEYFLTRARRRSIRPIRSISKTAMALLRRYRWPGNVRELENAIDYAVTFTAGDEIMPSDLPEHVLNDSDVSE